MTATISTAFFSDHRSSPDDAANLHHNLLAGNGLRLAGANLVSPPDRLHGPKALNLVGLRKVEALHELVRQSRP